MVEIWYNSENFVFFSYIKSIAIDAAPKYAIVSFLLWQKSTTPYL